MLKIVTISISGTLIAGPNIHDHGNSRHRRLYIFFVIVGICS